MACCFNAGGSTSKSLAQGTPYDTPDFSSSPVGSSASPTQASQQGSAVLCPMHAGPGQSPASRAAMQWCDYAVSHTQLGTIISSILKQHFSLSHHTHKKKESESRASQTTARMAAPTAGSDLCSSRQGNNMCKNVTMSAST